MDTIDKPKTGAEAGYQPAQGITKFIVDDVRALMASPLPGDVIEVTRHSDTAGRSNYYRYCVEDVNVAQ